MIRASRDRYGRYASTSTCHTGHVTYRYTCVLVVCFNAPSWTHVHGTCHVYTHTHMNATRMHTHCTGMHMHRCDIHCTLLCHITHMISPQQCERNTYLSSFMSESRPHIHNSVCGCTLHIAPSRHTCRLPGCRATLSL